MSAVVFQRVEGLAMAAVALLVVWYGFFDYPWFAYLVLFLLPDISMFGYRFGPRVGAVVYNMGHMFALPFLLAAAAFVAAAATPYLAALLWIAHIGIDRALGFGLKHQSGFKDTHLGRIRRF